MLFAKANFSLCSLNNKLYSFGGITLDEDRIDIVECYDIVDNVWIYIGTMPSPFVAGSVVAYHNAFFIMGGRVGVGKLRTPSFNRKTKFSVNLIKGRINSCYMFKPTEREWTEIESMRVGRYIFLKL